MVFDMEMSIAVTLLCFIYKTLTELILRVILKHFDEVGGLLSCCRTQNSNIYLKKFTWNGIRTKIANLWLE